MNIYLVTALLALGAGALYAGLAYGLILIQRGAGVIFFALGATSMYVAYVYSELRASGRYMVPPLPNPLVLIEGIAALVGGHLELPDWPTFIDLGDGMSFPVAFALATLTAAALGVIYHLLVFRPIRHSPTLAKVIASVGIMLILQATVERRFGSDARRVAPILPSENFIVLGRKVAYDRLLLAGIVLVVGLALTALYRWTKLGWATQAAAENEKGAILSGLSPSRLAGFSWILASLLAGIFGILFSTLTALTPTNFTFFVIPALAAAMVARFNSFLVAYVGGLVIAILEQITPLLTRDFPFLPSVGLAQALPLVIIIAVLFVRSDAIPRRGDVVDQDLPPATEMRRPAINLAVFGVLGALGVVFLPAGYRGALINSYIGIIIALSLVVIVGFVGQISLMQLSLAGISAVAVLNFTGKWGLPFPLAPILAALVAGVVGVIISLPALRIRGVQLAIVTLSTAVAIEAMVLRNETFLNPNTTAETVPPPSLFGLKFGINDSFFITRDGLPNPGFGIFTLLITLAACASVIVIRRSHLGRMFLAVRSNERACTAIGFNTAIVKGLAIAIASLLAGVAGALGTYRFQGVSPESYVALLSLSALAVAYLGGISTVGGAIIAGFLVTGGLSGRIIRDVFDAPDLEPLIAGVGLVLAAVLNPSGISGATVNHFNVARSKLWRRNTTPVTQPLITDGSHVSA